MRNKRQQLLIILVGAVVTLWLADRLLLTPLLKSWNSRASAIADLRKKVEDGRSLLRREQSLLATWSNMQTNTLPSNRPAAEEQILKAFNAWSEESRITVLSISPQWKQENEQFQTLEFRVEASGALDAAARFLYEIEHHPMALRLQTVELSSRDNLGQQVALGLQVSGLVLTPDKEQVRR